MSDQSRSSVLIADDHHVVREGIQNSLREHPKFTVAGTATDGSSAVEKTRELQPDVLILDVSMPSMNGVKVAEKVRHESPRTQIVVYSMYAEMEYVISLFRAGISAYVLKEEPLSSLINALEAVRSGGTYYSQKINDLLHEHMLYLEMGDKKEALEMQDGIARLSRREKEVFPLLADGMTIYEIADRLCISPKTVETHKYKIFEKLGSRSVADLTKLAVRKGLISV